MPRLFSQLTLRDLTLRNRIGVSPMCQYSASDGLANDWHLVNLGAFAAGGAGLVFTEATSVTPEGRISPQDLGIWSDAQIPMLRRITDFIHANGSVAGIQLGHAGRKASTRRPWEGYGTASVEEGGWENVMAPSAVLYSSDYPRPQALTLHGITHVIECFAAAAKRALRAGFKVVEVHAAHGYLLHQFMSPLANQRTDEYGGSLLNRIRLASEVSAAVRAVWPKEWPVFVRISVTDWADGGWTAEESVQLARHLRSLGVDVIDCSSGGLAAHQKIVGGRGLHVPFARRIRDQADIATAVVGMITDAQQAESIVGDGDADMVLLGRELLRNPHWPLLAAHQLHTEGSWPPQYVRARPK